eukprot:1957718-Pleurochrysis_carterae.AAC.1
MPVVAFAPPARRPHITPLLVGFRSRAFWIGRLPAGFLPTLLFTSHCECVSSAWIGLELGRVARCEPRRRSARCVRR